MHFSLTDEQVLLRDSVQRLMARIATPEYMRRLELQPAFPEDLYRAWAEAGLIAAPFPKEYSGLGGTVADVAIIAEIIARTSSDLVMSYAASIFCGLNVFRHGTPQQKKAWLPKLATGNVKFSIGLSEPDAGSDLTAIRTSATLRGSDYVINGLKTWQTGAGADRNVINLYVRTGESGDHRRDLSLLLVPKDAPGVTIRKLAMLGRRCTGTYEVTFDDAKVSKENLIGREGDGWRYLLSGLTAERAVVAACDCGSASAVVDMIVLYAKERKQFGRSIGTNQALAHAIADMQTEVEAARALTWRAVGLASTGGADALRDVTMAKLFAAEAYVKACNLGMQVFGGNGYSLEYDIQRHYRDCRIATVAAGSSQMLRNLIAGLAGLRVS